MAVWECRWCKYQQDTEWDALCPGCKGIYRAKKITGDSEQSTFSTLGGGAAKSTRQYHSTGQPGLDYVLGGGLVAGRVVLLGGFAGVGKMRLLLPVCDFVAKAQGNVIYATGEEAATDVNDVAAQLGIRNDRVMVMGNQRSAERVLEWAKKMKAFLVIYDSAQKFASDQGSGSHGSTAQCKAVGEVVKTYCGETKTTAIIVNQMSGTGELKSGTELEHHCDTVMILAYPKDDDEDAPEEKDIRVLSGGKNRVGPENRKSYFRMTDEGVMEHVAAKSKLIEFPARGRYRKRRDEEREED